MKKIVEYTKQHKKITVASVLFFIISFYSYKCLTNPLYFKSELYENNRANRCIVLSNYIPDGTTREYVEKILIDSDGARITPNNPISKGIEVGSTVYDLRPWVLYSNDAAYMYVWYDNNAQVIGLDGTGCAFLKRNPNRGDNK